MPNNLTYDKSIMTFTKNKKLLFATTIATVALTAMMVFIATNTVPSAVAQVKGPQTVSVSMKFNTPESFVASGGRSAVHMDVPVTHVDLKRGTTTSVDITLKHITGNNPYPFVNVSVVTPYHEIFYSPALTASTTPEQRLFAAQTGNLIPGSVDLSTLVSYSETGPIRIDAGGQHVIKMYITVPENMTSDFIGSGHFEIPLKITDSDGNSDTVVWQNGRIDFTVVN